MYIKGFRAWLSADTGAWAEANIGARTILLTLLRLGTVLLLYAIVLCKIIKHQILIC